ncbi:MAG: LamG domain-containing protein [Candidatus Poribacteria bacterium]
MLARLVVALSVVILAATARGELRDGLILYLPLDEVDGRAAVDASPTRADSAVSGTAAWMPSQGAFGGGLSLAGGRDGGIAVAHDFGVLDAVTTAAWMRIEDPQPPRWDYLFDARNRDVDEDDGAPYFGRSRAATIRFGDSEAAADAYPRGVWTHFALTADSREANLYVDGKLVQVWDAPSLNVGDRLVVGNRHTFTDALFGALDEFAMWSRPLSALEIRELTRRRVLPVRSVGAEGKAATAWAALRRAAFSASVVVERQ